MPRDFSRTDRIGDQLQQELVQLIRDEMRDPRIGMVNVTGVDVTKDLSAAKVYVNFVVTKSDDDAVQAVKVLNNAAGFLRTSLAKVMKQLRTVPKLRFIYDGSGEHGQQVSALIDYALAQDREHHLHDESSGEND